MTSNNTPEQDFISDLIPIFKRYLSYRKIEGLEQDLNELQTKLNTTEQESSESSSRESNSRGSLHSRSNHHIDITFRDLKDDVQLFIANAVGFSTVEELIAEYPHLDDPITCLEF